jgi:phytanoyl-CoA hydroxylase
MNDMAYLTDTQLRQYARDGYLVLSDFASAAQCAVLRQRASEIVAAFDPAETISIFSTDEQTQKADEYFMTSGDQVRCFFEEEAFDERGQLRQAKEFSINKIGHALHELDPVFERFSQQVALRALAQDLGYVDPRLLQSTYIFKQPGIGGEVVCHQDATFLLTDPPSVTAFWFALEPANVENGCLRVLPGGHKQGLKKLWLREGQMMQFETLDETAWAEDALVPLEVETGTMIMFDGLLPHRSFANRSPRSRHAYTLHLIEGTAKYLEANWLQRATPAPGFVEFA